MALTDDVTSCLIDNNKLFKDIIYTAQYTATSANHLGYNDSSKHNSSSNSSNSSNSKPLPPCFDLKDAYRTQAFATTTVPHDIENPSVKRIQRRLVDKFLLTMRSFISSLLSLPILALLVSVAIYKTTVLHLQSSGDQRHHSMDEKKEALDELLSQDETYYIRRWGYACDTHQVLTPDGYILKMHRIYKKGPPEPSQGAKDTKKKPPVLLGHGLFQCSGAFVLNEEKSLAFMLVDAGYDVWVGNNRSIAGFGHISLSHKDHEYWNWGLKELGVYDFCSMVDHVKVHSQVDKVAYIGHSQGNAQAFVALSLCPEIADSLSCFIALAPAVYAGELVKNFPLSLLIGLNDWFYTLLFGNGCFLPIMSVAQQIIGPKIFCFMAYSMFSYLFNWWDHHWLRRRKAKYFQFTPRPVSVRLISDWISGWGRQGVLLYVQSPPPPPPPQQQQDGYRATSMTTTTVSSMPLPLSAVGSKRKLPLVVFYGTADYLVDGQKFVEKVQTCNPFPMLDLVHVERLEGYEHMDTIWGHDNHITTYPIILDQLSKVSYP
ncbi:Alpha/Beta hydrolase protein [Mycotypha africana]|uniref:Alpha/Beta hydrolase protein n=1 Tax=Mycotypha africana TaxID=64632 RepID=UPI0023008D06|nr:Alpha/Beta hydrolase protein [Mycotypha africana]KAI8987910.1 Alpha/Beta hydrolase protein [Mycotypha africana]